jgi:hypothetical protein
MKKMLVRVSTVMAVLASFLGCLLINQACTRGEVMLEVLNPRGEIELPPVSAPSPRVTNLAGKRVGLYWNEKSGGNHFLNGIERLLSEGFPDTTVLRYRGAFDLGDMLAAKIAEETDAFIYGVGD